LSKYQKRAALFALLSAIFIMLGQATRTSFTYAPLFAFLAGFLSIILAAINASKTI